MADSFTFTPDTSEIVITIVDGYRLNVGGFAKDIKQVHIPFTNVTFERNEGFVSARARAEGLETFTTLEDAATFKLNIAGMEGQSVRIRHDRLTDAAGFDAICMTTNRPGVNTNKTPGFHVIWTADFSGFPFATP